MVPGLGAGVTVPKSQILDSVKCDERPQSSQRAAAKLHRAEGAHIKPDPLGAAQ